MAAEPRWLELARNYIGLREIKGPQHQAEILRMAQDAYLGWIKDDETAWCSIFVCAMVERAGAKSTRSAAARSWMGWGVDVLWMGAAQLPLGAIVVYSRPPDPAHGHVGFAAGVDRNGRILTLGGNQSDQVSIAPFDPGRVVAARWLPNSAETLRLLPRIPFINTGAPASAHEA